jgi:hypothetical protein
MVMLSSLLSLPPPPLLLELVALQLLSSVSSSSLEPDGDRDDSRNRVCWRDARMCSSRPRSSALRTIASRAMTCGPGGCSCTSPSLAAKGINAGSVRGDRGDTSSELFRLVSSASPPLTPPPPLLPPPVLNLVRFLVEKSDLRPSDFIPLDKAEGDVGSPSASWAWPMLPGRLPLPLISESLRRRPSC